MEEKNTFISGAIVGVIASIALSFIFGFILNFIVTSNGGSQLPDDPMAIIIIQAIPGALLGGIISIMGSDSKGVVIGVIAFAVIGFFSNFIVGFLLGGIIGLGAGVEQET